MSSNILLLLRRCHPPRVLTLSAIRPHPSPSLTAAVVIRSQPQSTTPIRFSSHSPLSSNLSSSSPSRKKVTLPSLQAMYSRNEPITMLTAHDFPSAHAANSAGMDMILIGDSLAMVALGLSDTSAVTVEDMLLHCRSVARGSPNGAFIVGDLPMGSYEISPEQALATAIRFVKEGNVHGVKLEGGKSMAPQIRKIVEAGIPVLAHVGLTPQRQNALGGFRVQGKSTEGALGVWRDAVAVRDAGAFGVVLEAVPEEVAGKVTEKLGILTIGIGAGKGCSGQVLVQVDMLGFYPPGRKVPKFAKRFGDVWGEVNKAIETYRDEVKGGVFPAAEHTYPMPKEEFAEFERIMDGDESSAVGEKV